MKRTGLNARALRECTRWNGTRRRGGRRRRKQEVPFIGQPNHYAQEHALLAESAPLYDPQVIETPEAAMIAREDAYTLHRLIDTLPARVARVIRLRFGLGCEPHDLDGIGAQLGRSKERVRQIQDKGLRLLGRPTRAKWLERPHGANWGSQARRNLYTPDWKLALIGQAEADDVRRTKQLEKEARRAAAAKREAAEQREYEASLAERAAAIARQLEKERRWIADAPKRAAEQARRELEWRAMAAKAREQWHKDEMLRQWAYTESQAAAAALRVQRPPTVPVYSPTYNAAFRRPIYAQVKHG
jgi:hypothetical protein